MRRNRNAKIVATLGPASSSEEVIRNLFVAGVDMFRLNFSHGTHAQHKERFDIVRRIGQEFHRPVGILGDLQGPKLRVGTFSGDGITLVPGAVFRLDLNPAPGDASRVNLPHPEIFAALVKGATLLLDDGKLALQVEEFGPDYFEHTQSVHISADTYRLVAPFLHDKSLHFYEEVLELNSANVQKVAKSVRESRKALLPPADEAPALCDRLAELNRRALEMMAELREISKASRTGKPSPLFGSQLKGTLTCLRSEFLRVCLENGVV